MEPEVDSLYSREMVDGDTAERQRTNEMLEALDAASEEYDADIYLYSGAIEENGYGKVAEIIPQHKRKANAVLILTTNGGSANAAYQIARLFQRTYDRFLLCAPSTCKSAGTLLAIGAHTLLLDAFCDLGPLDVQLLKQNEIGARKSGLLARSSFQALGDAAFELYERLMIGITIKSGGLVSFKMASELSATMAGQLLAPVYGQINPDVVGSENRDLNVALHYGVRLADISGNCPYNSVLRLVQDYPSHDFIIDFDECHDLFKSIELPSDSLYTVLGYLGQLAYDESPSCVVLGLSRPLEAQNHDTTDIHSEDDTAKGRGPDAVDDDRVADRQGDTGQAVEKPQRSATDAGGATQAPNAGGNSRGAEGRDPVPIRSVGGPDR